LRNARVRSFGPIAARDAKILILGSMPGRASLAAGQYYAHRQNAFWRIVGSLLEIDPASPYKARVRALRASRIAVWDVLHSCVRPGSLDSSIEQETANDFKAFFRSHPGIAQVFFNGAKAEASFHRHVLPVLERPLHYARLPSTSPAHASIPYARKLKAWQAVLRG
jgi:TDG/mug DNA glycosylase family protein